MESYPCAVRSNPTIKSMPISSHFQLGIGKGWSKLADGSWQPLILLHVSHLTVYSAISFFIHFHQKLYFKSWYILLLPGWIENLERWASSMILFRNSWSLGTNNQLPKPKNTILIGSKTRRLGFSFRYFVLDKSDCLTLALGFYDPILQGWLQQKIVDRAMRNNVDISAKRFWNRISH